MNAAAADPLVARLRHCCLRVMGAKPGCGFFVTPQLLITCSDVVGPPVPVGARVELSTWGTGGAAAGPDGDGRRLQLQAEVLANDATDDLALLRLAAGGHPHVAHLAGDRGGGCHPRRPLALGGFAKPLACIETLLSGVGQALVPVDPRWTDAEVRQRQPAEGAAPMFPPEQLLQLRQMLQGPDSSGLQERIEALSS